MEAYYNRKSNLAKMAEPEDIREQEKAEKLNQMPPEEYGKAFINTEGDGLRFHTFEDIGKYTLFPT